jgi:hypothetical protein
MYASTQAHPCIASSISMRTAAGTPFDSGLPLLSLCFHDTVVSPVWMSVLQQHTSVTLKFALVFHLCISIALV